MTPRATHPGSSRGFSLIEVLIALAVLAVGVIAVMKLFPTSMRQTQVAHERTVASELATGRLGRIENAGANQLFNNVENNTAWPREFPNFTSGDLDWNSRDWKKWLFQPQAWLVQSEAIERQYRALYQSFTIYDGFTTSVQRMAGAEQVYLQRVTFDVVMFDGRRETFVTYVSQM